MVAFKDERYCLYILLLNIYNSKLLTYSIYFSYAIFLIDYKKIKKNSLWSETVDCSPTSGSELLHALERCALHHSCQMLYFFQNNVVPLLPEAEGNSSQVIFSTEVQ
jgi:hypothetical protein